MRKLSDILNEVKFTVLIGKELKRVKDIYNENIIFIHNGGVFRADNNTLTFINLLKDNTPENESITLIDINDYPIIIDDPAKFIKDLLDTYYLATNKYYDDFNKIKKMRSKEQVLE